MESPSAWRRFLAELKRRNVYRVAVAYLAVAFIGLQAVNLLVPSTTLPSWADELPVALAVFGFPVALVLAWAFELTPEGVRRAAPVQTEHKAGPADDMPRWHRRRGVLISTALAAVLGFAAYTLFGTGQAPGEETPQIRSLAVLPLDNFSGDPDQEYFADGMTEQLIMELAQMEELLVISRSAVMRYKENPKPIREVAEDLNVDAVIEGSVLRVEEEVRITAQLIDAETEAHLWARDYVRDFRDLLSLQKDVARAIVDEIQGELTSEEKGRLTGGRSVDTEAQEAFL